MNRYSDRQHELFKSIIIKNRSRFPKLPQFSKMESRIEHSKFFEEKFLPKIKNKINESNKLPMEQLLPDQDSLYWLNSFELFSSDNFAESKKFLIHSKNISKLKALVIKEKDKEKLKNLISVELNNLSIENKIFKYRFRFKKIVKIVLIVLRFLNLYKINRSNQQSVDEVSFT